MVSPEGLQASVQPSGSSANVVTPPDYLLGPEDVIEVTVWKNENLSRVVAIRPDGKISLPLIGDVQAAGLTTARVRESIRAKLKEFKETPEVSVIVREINSLVVYITGEVIHPGKLSLRSDTSILQAIIMAGGFTQYASPNKIVLLRRVGAVETRKVIRYKDIVSGQKPQDDVILQRGDTIVVP
jgi:polysaccharide export outer membrane protein